MPETEQPQPEEGADLEVVAHQDDEEQAAACCIINWSNEL